MIPHRYSTKQLLVPTLALLTLGLLAAQFQISPSSAAPASLIAKPPTAAAKSHPARALARNAFGQLPLSFIENRGQLDAQVAYYLQGSDKTIYFTAEGLTFSLTGTNDEPREPQ